MSHDHGRKVVRHDREARHDRGGDLTPGQDFNFTEFSGRGMPGTRSHTIPSNKDTSMIDDSILNELYDLPSLKQNDPSNSQFEENENIASLSYQRQESDKSFESKYQAYSSKHQYSSTMGSRNQSEGTSDSEMSHNLSTSKQIQDYIIKAEMLREELGTLKDQRNELQGAGSRSPSPETKRFLKENTKLQLEIQNKIKTINNMVDTLNGIGVENTQDVHVSEEPPDQKCKSRSSPTKKFNYVYYDPEMHWCRVCDVFPPTAKDYLNHLHSAEHQQNAAQHIEAPWHSVDSGNEGYPSVPTAPTKRTPIKGLQFFVPTLAWYCKLCDRFMGDLHCASAHIKSMVHSKNYMNFVEHNPHWETDWMSDRQKALEKACTVKNFKPVEDKPSCLVQYTAQTITISKEAQTQRVQKSPSPQLAEKKYKKKKRRKERSESPTTISSTESESFKHKKVKRKKLKPIDVTDSKDLEQWMSSLQGRVTYREERRRETRSTSRDRERIREMQRKIRESESRLFRSYEPRDQRDRSRDRRSDSRDWRDGSRDRSRDRRDERPDPHEPRLASRDRRQNPRVPEPEAPLSLAERMPLPPPGLALPLPRPSLPPALPPALPPPMLLPPPVHSQAPAANTELPSVPKEFQEALEIIFPTDPAKCNEMLQQRDMFNAMQQPSLLGMPPALGIPGMGFPHLGMLQPGMSALPGMYGFELNPGPGLFPTPPPPLFNPHLTILPAPPKPRAARSRPRGSRPAARPKRAAEDAALDDLTMLGMDAGDVGAGV